MLGTLLEKLQALLPKRLLLAHAAPLTIFALINGALLAYDREDFRSFAKAHLWDAESGVVRNVAVLSLALFLSAFLLSILNTRLRELMEGRGWPRLLARTATRMQTAKLEALDERLERAEEMFDKIQENREAWQGELRDARKEGNKRKRCSYPSRRPAALKIEELRAKKRSGIPIEAAELESAVDLLKAVLEKNRADPPAGTVAKNADRLDRDHTTLSDLLTYADKPWIALYNETDAERQIAFPEVLAPTAMGNIAASMSSYSLTRYGLNVELLWTRLQKSMQADTFLAVLQDAKTQLDFTVSCFWLTLLSVALWLPYLTLFGYDTGLLIAFGAAGPLLLWLVYRLCLQSYRGFADLVRCSVDTFRFKLLDELHLPRPATRVQELRLWRAVGKHLRYGESVGLAYKKKSS